MSELALVLTQTRYALISTSRNPRAVVFSLLFPVILLVLFNEIFVSSTDTVMVAGHTIDGQTYFTAGMIAYSTGLLCFTQPLVALTAQRERGQLKRLRGTPIPAWTFITAQVLRSVLLALFIGCVMLGMGIAFWSVDLTARTVPGFLILLFLGTGSLCALGVAMTSFTTTEDTASSIGPFTMVMLSFISGIFIPIDQLPGWLQEIGRIFPLYHLTQGLQLSISGARGGIGLNPDDVASLVLWGIAGIAIASRRFLWEPQGHAAGA
jgi:ABC-2 type transport system permease protein